MTRRTITIHLDPQCETPATLDYIKNPVAEVTKDRGEFISAALIIVRAWVVAGKPITAVKSLNSYGDWSDLCRQPLLWLDLKDPANSVFESMAYDPDRNELEAFLGVWLHRYGSRSISVKKIASDTSHYPDLKEVIPYFVFEHGVINNVKLGRWIKRHSGRVVNGLRLVADKSVKLNVMQWKIEIIDTGSTLSGISGISASITNIDEFSRIEEDCVTVIEDEISIYH